MQYYQLPMHLINHQVQKHYCVQLLAIQCVLCLFTYLNTFKSKLVHKCSDNQGPTVYVYIYIIYHFVWADQRQVQGNISYITLQLGQYLDNTGNKGNIAWKGGFFDLYTLIFRCCKETFDYVHIYIIGRSKGTVCFIKPAVCQLQADARLVSQNCFCQQICMYVCVCVCLPSRL